MVLLADGPNATLQTERLDQCRSLIKSRKNKSSRDMFFVHSLIVSLEILLLFRPIVDGVFALSDARWFFCVLPVLSRRLCSVVIYEASK